MNEEQARAFRTTPCSPYDQKGELRIIDTQSRTDTTAPQGVHRWLRAADRVPLLSPQEKKVFRLLGDGYSNRRIAREMGVTERTTKEYMSRVLEKMGVESRLQAGLISFAHQLRGDSTEH